MTETKWASSTDPFRMLLFLREEASDRQLLLFVVACWKDIWDELSDRPNRQIVSKIEKKAEQGKTCERSSLLRLVSQFEEFNVPRVWNDNGGFRPDWTPEIAKVAATLLLTTTALDPAETLLPSRAYVSEARSKVRKMDREVTRAWTQQLRLQSSLLRDVLRNPFREKPDIAKARGSRRTTIFNLAEAIYADRAFDRLPILADALEEAGCTDADILAHCRGPGPHVRGCWVVDMILDKT